MILGLLAAASLLIVEPGLDPISTTEANRAWREVEKVYGTSVTPKKPIRIRADAKLPRGTAGKSVPGLVSLRAIKPDPTALRHELAHQLLWEACPASADDRLFHEAFATAASGEVGVWDDGEYVSVPQARRTLERAHSLDTKESRRAIARLLVDATPSGEIVPVSIAKRVRDCRDGARWAVGMSVEELADAGTKGGADAWIVISRHSGEVIESRGAAGQPMPFASTLKPFLIAGARATPVIARAKGRAEWECGEDLPDELDAQVALLRSCNGWFLDWAARDASAPSFGEWADLLVDLGLERAPSKMEEAIGVVPSLSLSPWAMAHAYRVLAEARPDLIGTMTKVSAEGTLADLAVSARMRGIAAKTGTVRDSESRPRLGWIVAVDADFIAVMTRRERAPRTFADDFIAEHERVRSRPGIAAASVQVFGLLEGSAVEARCGGTGWRLEAKTPKRLTAASSIDEAVKKGPLLCAGGEWTVTFEGGPADGRPYAGIFARDAAPAYRPPAGMEVTEKQRRARRGSDVAFRTTLLRYVAGVLDAEDSAIEGPAREALARVIAHDAGREASHERHPSRAVCDTTHCQAFQGTRTPRLEDARAIGRGPLPYRGWLAFSQGGDDAWTERRPRRDVEQATAPGATGLSFAGGKLRFLKPVREGDGVYEEMQSLSCEPFRNRLRLPSCPSSAAEEGGEIVFRGRGRGHGLGLDVEAAKASRASADEILETAYRDAHR